MPTTYGVYLEVRYELMSHILIADRNPHFRKLYQFVFRDYDLYEAGSINQALSCLERQPVDLLLTEWEFPDGTARKLLEHLQLGQQVPVVLVSLIQDTLPPLPSVVKRRLNKPFHLPELRSAIRQLLPE